MPEEKQSSPESKSILGRMEPMDRRDLLIGMGACVGLAILAGTAELSCEARLPDISDKPSDQPPDYVTGAGPGN